MKQSGNKHKSEEEETKMGRIFCILTGYLCGSFLTAELVAQERIGKSAFEIGTGNPGMANLAEQGGVGCALLPAEETEGKIRYPGHGSQDAEIRQFDISDFKRLHSFPLKIQPCRTFPVLPGVLFFPAEWI